MHEAKETDHPARRVTTHSDCWGCKEGTPGPRNGLVRCEKGLLPVGPEGSGDVWVAVLRCSSLNILPWKQG